MTRQDAIIEIVGIKEEFEKRGVLNFTLEDALNIAISDIGSMDLLSQVTFKMERGEDRE